MNMKEEYDMADTLISCFGKTMSIAEWSRVTGIPWEDLYNRTMKMGWPARKALIWPINIEKRGTRKDANIVKSVKSEVYKMMYEYDRKKGKEALKQEINAEKKVEEKWIFKKYSSHSGMYVRNPKYKEKKVERVDEI